MDLKGKKVIFLGDSITEGVGASDGEHKYTSVFERKTGAEVVNYGISGTRIAKQKTPSLYERFDLDFNGRCLSMDEDADIVVVFGGTNDFGHGDAEFGNLGDTDEYTFCGAMRSLLEKLINRYPTSTIVVMTPLHRLGEKDPFNEIGLKHHLLSEYVKAEKEIAAEYSVPVLDLWSTSGIQPMIPVQMEKYTSDGLHPNDRGHEKIADMLAAFLKAM